MTAWSHWRFADPALLLGVVLLVPVVYAGLRGVADARLRFPSLQAAARFSGGRPTLLRHLPLVLRAVALFLMVLALARPQGGNVQRVVTSPGVDILMVIDTSGSMQAMDFTLGDERATRLDVARQVMREFVDGREQDRIGLVAFGEEAFLQCPTTVDYGVLSASLGALELRMAGDGTAIGNGIGTAIEGLRELPGRSKVIVLLTDGENTTGVLDPEQAARAAATYGIKIHTIGIGTEGKAPFLADGPFGQHLVYQEVHLDEALLRTLAEVTGGRYFRADSTDKMREIWRIIDEMEKVEVDVREFTDFHELAPFFLLPALIVLFLDFVLRATWLRTIP